MCNLGRFYSLRELYVSDFHKPGIYGYGRVWVNARDVFRCTPPRGDRVRRAAVDFVVGFGCGGISLFVDLFFFEKRTRPAASMRPPFLIFLFYSNKAVFCLQGKKASSYRGACRAPLFNSSACMSVCMCVCATFVVFTDCESCTSSISTNPGCIETDKYEPTRGRCFVARRLEVIAVTGLLWICLLYTSPSPRDKRQSRMPSSA